MIKVSLFKMFQEKQERYRPAQEVQFRFDRAEGRVSFKSLGEGKRETEQSKMARMRQLGKIVLKHF